MTWSFDTAEGQHSAFERLGQELDRQLDVLKQKRHAWTEATIKASDAEREARVLKAQIFLSAEGKSIAIREQLARHEASDAEHEARVAAALAKSAESAYFEQQLRIKQLLGKFSGLQSVSSTARAQMELAR